MKRSLRVATLGDVTYPPSPQPAEPDQPWHAEPPAPGPPRRRRRTGLVVLLACAAVLLLCCGGAAIAAGLSAQKNHETTGPATSTTAASPMSTTVQAIRAWLAGGGANLVSALGKDFDAFGATRGNPDPAAVRSTCVTLQKDIEAAQAYKPIPDAEAQRDWAAALAAYARAATDCIAGIDATNAAVLNRSATEMGQGTDALSKLNARLDAIKG